jgi:NTP pyrophosphatase (non-canonical NTP hydrolase)
MRNLIQRLREFRKARDWDSFHSARNLAEALNVEAGELLELFLWGAEPADFVLADELADVAIYALNLADVSGIDLEAAIQAKITKNEQRLPVCARPGEPAVAIHKWPS